MFTAAGSSTGVELIRQFYVPEYTQAVNYNNDLLPLFGEPQDSGGDTAHRWKFHRGGNSSIEVYTEGQGQPAAGSQLWASGAVSYLAFRGMLQVTGHARAAMRSRWVNGLDAEAVLLRDDLVDLITRTYLGSSNNGLEVAVDLTTNYAGLTRSASSYMASYENSVSAEISYSNMATTWQTGQAFDYGARFDCILVPWNQYRRYHAISGQPGMKIFQPGDVGQDLAGLTFAGIPIKPINDMTTTVAIWLDRRPGKWAHMVHSATPEGDPAPGGWEVKDMGPSGDSDIIQIAYRGHLVCHDPLRQAKMTGLTA